MTDADRWARVGALFDAAVAEAARRTRGDASRLRRAAGHSGRSAVAAGVRTTTAGDFMARSSPPAASLAAGRAARPVPHHPHRSAMAAWASSITPKTRACIARSRSNCCRPTLAGTERQRERLEAAKRARQRRSRIPTSPPSTRSKSSMARWSIASEYVEGETLARRDGARPAAAASSALAVRDRNRPRAWRRRTSAASCTATSSPRTSCARATARSRSSTSGWRSSTVAARELVSMTPDRGRARRRHAALHGTGAAARARHRLPHRPIRVRRADLRDDRGAPSVRWSIAALHDRAHPRRPNRRRHSIGDDLPPALWADSRTDACRRIRPRGLHQPRS